MINRFHSFRSNVDDRRSGLAAVEFAVCLPIMVTIVFAGMEASNAIHL